MIAGKARDRRDGWKAFIVRHLNAINEKWRIPCMDAITMNPILIHKTCSCGSENQQSVGRFAIIAAGVVLLALSAASCATTRGFGQDVETAGENIEQAASR
jgi:predicted small secreted protein